MWLGARLAGFFPGRIEPRRYGLYLPVLVGWTHPFAPLGTPLVAAEVAEETITAWLDHVANNPDLPNWAILPLLPDNGPFAKTLKSVLRKRKDAAFDRHARALLAPGPQRSGYLERMTGAGRRKEWRRQRRRLEEKGPVSLASAGGAAAAAALDDFFALEASGWKGRAGTAARDNAEIREFMRKAIAGLADNASVHRLLVDGRPIAAAITLRSRDHGWWWKIAHDESWAQFSPGVLLTRELTENLLRDGSLARVNSCATADHPMIDRLWGERLALADRLIRPRPSAALRPVRSSKSLRRAAVRAAKSLRRR